MKRLIPVFLFFGSLLIVAITAWYLSKYKPAVKSVTLLPPVSSVTIERLTSHAEEAKSFVRKKGFNDTICLLIDMSLESGKKRFFIYDLLNDSITGMGLVTHGRCNETWLSGRKYGNEVGCGCTSLGKYKIGHSYRGRFGLAYKLIGLDKTNNNAFKRYVVLHSHECVPEQEVDPVPICQSDGCPTVSKSFLEKLSGIIGKSSKPLLLWIYG